MQHLQFPALGRLHGYGAFEPVGLSGSVLADGPGTIIVIGSPGEVTAAFGSQEFHSVGALVALLDHAYHGATLVVDDGVVGPYFTVFQEQEVVGMQARQAVGIQRRPDLVEGIDHQLLDGFLGGEFLCSGLRYGINGRRGWLAGA